MCTGVGCAADWYEPQQGYDTLVLVLPQSDLEAPRQSDASVGATNQPKGKKRGEETKPGRLFSLEIQERCIYSTLSGRPEQVYTPRNFFFRSEV